MIPCRPLPSNTPLVRSIQRGATSVTMSKQSRHGPAPLPRGSAQKEGRKPHRPVQPWLQEWAGGRHLVWPQDLPASEGFSRDNTGRLPRTSVPPHLWQMPSLTPLKPWQPQTCSPTTRGPNPACLQQAKRAIKEDWIEGKSSSYKTVGHKPHTQETAL